jgi:hypothetical protein
MSDRLNFMHPEWFLYVALNAILTTHRLRKAVGAPSCEYGIESEIGWMGSVLHLGKFKCRSSVDVKGKLEPNPLLFPRLSFEDIIEISDVLNIIRIDLFNAAGFEPRQDRQLQVDIPEEYLS